MRQETIQPKSYRDQLTQFKIFAIVNCTPDSFSGDSVDVDAVVSKIQQQLADGADVIDIGAESTRPGAQSISAAEEIKRLSPALEYLKIHSIPFSIDTHKPEVMAYALEHGAAFINDTRALQTPGSLEVAAHQQGRSS